MDPEQLFFERAVGRIQRFILLWTVAGAVAAWLHGGWRWGVGFLLGAGASWFYFRWLHQLVNSLGPGAAARRRRIRVAVFLGLRYLLLGLAAYVILNYSTLSLAAALWGLCAPVAAVILEILFELLYAGT